MPTGPSVTVRVPHETAGLVSGDVLGDQLHSKRKSSGSGRCVWSRPETPNTGRKGSKRRQRYLNLRFLLDLRVDGETEPEGYASAKNTHFSSLLTDSQATEEWWDFTQQPLDRQREFVSQADASSRPTHVAPRHSKALAATLSPEYCFSRMDRRLRTAFKTTHVPLGTVEVLEGQLVGVFEEDPGLVLVLTVDSPYLRCLLHGMAQYYGLDSYSETGLDGVRQTFVENRSEHFVVPPVALSTYLQRMQGTHTQCPQQAQQEPIAT